MADRLSIILIALVISAQVSAAPLQQRDVPTWLHNIFYPDPGNGSPSAQIQCYALPYGGLGVASHFLTYITAIILMLGREPLRPWKELKQGTLPRLWNTILGTLSLVITVIIAGLTMRSCRGDWAFVLLAFWKLTLSFSMGMLSIIGPWHHSHHRQHVMEGKGTVKDLPWTLFPYIAGTLVGIVGLFDIIHLNFGNNRNIWILCITLIVVASVALLVAIGIAICAGGAAGFGGFVIAVMVFVAIFVALVVFFSDLVLAALNNNWSGVPTDDNRVLFWLYFASKRLPMLSI